MRFLSEQGSRIAPASDMKSMFCWWTAAHIARTRDCTGVCASQLNGVLPIGGTANLCLSVCIILWLLKSPCRKLPQCCVSPVCSACMLLLLQSQTALLCVCMCVRQFPAERRVFPCKPAGGRLIHMVSGVSIKAGAHHTPRFVGTPLGFLTVMSANLLVWLAAVCTLMC